MSKTFLFVLHCLYVGEGDCTIFEYQNDKKKYLYCIDFGSNISLIQRKTDVVKYLEKLGCKNKNTKSNISKKTVNECTERKPQATVNSNVELNCLLTHPHFDHYQYLSLLHRNFNINKFFYSNLYDDYPKVKFVDRYFNTFKYNKKVREVVKTFFQEQKQQVFSDDIILKDDNICMKVLWPTKDYKKINNDFNDNSMVLLITLLEKNKNIILMADAGVRVEKEIMKKYPELKDVDIIKIGHHGNSSASSQVFIDKMNPKIVINSTGPHLLSLGFMNFHTSRKVMNSWQRARNGEAKIYTTYKRGDISVIYDEKSNGFIIKQ